MRRGERPPSPRRCAMMFGERLRAPRLRKGLARRPADAAGVHLMGLEEVGDGPAPEPEVGPGESLPWQTRRLLNRYDQIIPMHDLLVREQSQHLADLLGAQAED